MIKKLYSYVRPLHIPNEVKNRKGKILLHIGDIPVWGYPYAKRLIKKIHPDVLVHTGDLADDYKVGRLEEHIAPYKKYVPKLINAMEKYGKEVYIVPGNNDIEEFINEVVSESKVLQPNTVMEICGIKFLLCHRVMDLDGEADFYLYGHGPTWDTHSFHKPEDGKVFSNVFFAPSVVFLDDRSYVELKNYNGGTHR